MVDEFRASEVPPEEMAEIVKEVIEMTQDCVDCGPGGSVAYDGKVEDIELDPYNPNDFKKLMKHVATVNIEGGIAAAEEYIKKLSDAYGSPTTITANVQKTAEDWLNKKYDQYECDHQHDKDPQAVKDADGIMKMPEDFDPTPMILVDGGDNFRAYVVAGKVDEMIQKMKPLTDVRNWRAVTYEEFEELNKGL
jgi:hypothetical protein